MRLAREGSEDAFRLLVERHARAAYRLALRLTGDPEEAEEAAQDALVQAWRGLATFRDESGFSTWLYRIVTNRCANVRRDRRPATDKLSETLAATARMPHDAAADREEFDLLVRAIAELPFDQRAPLVLHHFEACSYDEIAVILHTTVPAVKGRIHRARRSLLLAVQGSE